MKQYDLVLKNEKERSYRRISIFLFAINFISILYLTYERNFTRWGPFILSIIAVLAVFASFYFKNTNEKMTFTLAFFFFILAWQTAGFWLPEILNFLFSILYLYASKTPIVNINEKEVTYPSFPKKRFNWIELSNLILKDGLLTIDLKNNRIIQQQIVETSSTIDEKEFNEFCLRQLNK